MATPPIWTNAFTSGAAIPNWYATKTMSNVWGSGPQADAAAAVFTEGLPTTGFSSKTAWQDSAKILGVEGADIKSLYSLAPDSFNIPGLTGPTDTSGAEEPTAAWTFITAPQKISWDVSNVVNQVDMFGTNNPPVISGTRGLAELSLSDSLVEGFTRGVQVEAKIAALQALLNYSLNRKLGFVDVPVYQVNANDKKYGGANAFFIIKSVKVEEQMRDLSGNMTRAKVDISLIQVPEFQVSNGRDLASKAAAGAKAPVSGQNAQASTLEGKSGSTVPNTKPQVPAGYTLKKTSVSAKGVTTKIYQNSAGQIYSIKS
jgi:hypothetical protein